MTAEPMRRWRSKAVLAIIALMLSYRLSAGPFVWLTRHGFISAGVYDALERSVYLPIVWCNLNVPSFASMFRWYLDFFR